MMHKGMMHNCMMAIYGGYEALHTMHELYQAVTKPFSSMAELAITLGKQA